MRWSWRLLRVAGIDIRVHATFLIILALGALGWSAMHGLGGAVFGAFMMVLLFTSVTLHELGHSLVAQRLGVPVREIVLLPIGGVAMMTGRPKRPAHELAIALAGPAVNVVLAAVLSMTMLALYGTAGFGAVGTVDATTMAPSVHTLLSWLLTGNVMLAVFNMVPAFPLDGGRVLRAILSMTTNPRRATEIAARVGQTAAVGLGMFALMAGNLVLVAISAFIFFGAARENEGERLRALLQAVPAGRAARLPATVLSPADRVGAAAERLSFGGTPELPVFVGGRVVGILDGRTAMHAAWTLGPHAYVGQVMDRHVARMDARQSLAELEPMFAQGARVVAIYDGPTLLGLITPSDVAHAATYLDRLDRMHHDGASSSSWLHPAPR